MLIICLLFVYFLIFVSLVFFTFLFFSPTLLKDTNPDSTEDSIPDSNLYFSWLFSNVQQISQVLPSKSAFCSKVSFFLYVDLLIFFCLCFCESSVESLFSSCFYFVSFFSELFFTFSHFVGLLFFTFIFLFFICFLNCVVFIGI